MYTHNDQRDAHNDQRARDAHNDQRVRDALIIDEEGVMRGVVHRIPAVAEPDHGRRREGLGRGAQELLPQVQPRAALVCVLRQVAARAPIAR